MNQNVLSVEEYRRLVDRAPQPKKRGKFGNKKTEVDGEKFDSLKESARYQHLKLLSSEGLIQNLKRQVVYQLRVNDILVCRYIADFVYRTADENPITVVEDVKSEITRKHPVYRLKKKLMKAIYNIEIREV